MAVDTQVTTFLDIYTDLQNRVRVETGVTATQNQAKRYANIALHDMHIGFHEKLPWAERRANLVTQPEYTTGTLSINRGDTALTGVSTLWNTNNDFGNANMRVGGRIVINSTEEVYTILSISSDTAAVLTSDWIDANASAVSYSYFEDEYALAADFLRPIDQQSFDDNREIQLIGRTEFRRRYPRNKTTGKPIVATIVDRAFASNTTPVRRIRFWKPPDSTVYMIPYNYITSNLAVSSSGTEGPNLSADTDEPIVPLRYRHAIIFHALYHWYRDKKDDTRSLEAKAEYVDIITRIVSDQEIGASRPRFKPRIQHYVARARRPYRGQQGGRRYTTGDAFDEMRD